MLMLSSLLVYAPMHVGCNTENCMSFPWYDDNIQKSENKDRYQTKHSFEWGNELVMSAEAYGQGYDGSKSHTKASKQQIVIAY